MKRKIQCPTGQNPIFFKLSSFSYRDAPPVVRRGRSRRGTTLYELLIAMALVSIIAAMSVGAVVSTTSFTESFYAANQRTDDIAQLRESVTAWYNEFSSDFFVSTVVSSDILSPTGADIPTDTQSGASEGVGSAPIADHTVIFVPRASLPPTSVNDDCPTVDSMTGDELRQRGYYLLFRNQTLISYRPGEEPTILFTSERIVSLNFSNRQGSTLVRCEALFDNGDRFVFMLRSL